MPSKLILDEAIDHLDNLLCRCPDFPFCSDCDPTSISEAAFYRRCFLVFWSHMFVRRPGIARRILERFIFGRESDDECFHDRFTVQLLIAIVSIDKIAVCVFGSYILDTLFR